jgi:hypothetical protein
MPSFDVFSTLADYCPRIAERGLVTRQPPNASAVTRLVCVPHQSVASKLYHPKTYFLPIDQQQQPDQFPPECLVLHFLALCEFALPYCSSALSQW